MARAGRSNGRGLGSRERRLQGRTGAGMGKSAKNSVVSRVIDGTKNGQALAAP